MFLADDIVLFPVKSLLSLFREIYNAAVQEIADEADSIRAELGELYQQLEAGTLDEQAFDARERELLDRLDAIEARGDDETEDEEDDDDQEEEEEDEDDEEDDEEEEEEDEGRRELISTDRTRRPPMTAPTSDEATLLDEEMLSAEDFLNRELGHSASRPSVVYSTRQIPASTARVDVPTEPPARDPRSKVLPRLLAMADFYRQEGSLRQALEMYFDLYRNHEDSPEAAQAEDRILDVARIHEQNGELHVARAIYEQLI